MSRCVRPSATLIYSPERLAMPREVVTIPRSELAAYEYGARVYSVLAYPDDPKARQRFDDALCYIGIKTLGDADGQWRHTYQPIRPFHLLQHPDAVDMTYAEGSRIIANERLIAAKMAAPTYAKQAQEIGLTLPKQPTPLSLEVVAAVAVDLDDRPRRGSREEIVGDQFGKCRPSPLEAEPACPAPFSCTSRCPPSLELTSERGT